MTNILICIFNYKQDDNARKWLTLLSPHFDTYVLDSGNDHKCKDFIQFPNIYYSGLFNETKKLAEKKQYNWVGIICSDVTISKDNENDLINKIKWLNTTTNIGSWQASFDLTSAKRNKKHSNFHKYEAVTFIEGMFVFMKYELLSKFPYIDTQKNKYGMYIDNVFSAYCIDNGYLNIYDNTIIIHHPEGSGYDKSKRDDYISWCDELKFKLTNKKISTNNKKGLNFKESQNPVIKYIREYKTDNITIRSKTNNPIIVTFTSWKKRLHLLPKFFENLKNQTILPDKFILWLSSDEVTINDIPTSLLKEKLLEIHWVDKNLKSFKKFLSVEQHPEAYNIILDDDRMYNNKTIEVLLQKSEQCKNTCIISYYADICNSKGEPWGENQNDKTEILWVNDSCVLYPPYVFPEEAFDYFYSIMKTKSLVSDECFLMPFIISKKLKIDTIGGTGSKGLKELNKFSPMISDSQKDALHKMFFYNNSSNTLLNLKNKLIKDIIKELPHNYYISYKSAFKNFKYDTCDLDIVKKNVDLWRICKPAENKDFIQDFSKKDDIIISITSWKKRIDNVSHILLSIINGEDKPDWIVINLALPEFPNKEKDLPEDLIKLINDYHFIEINWLEYNTLVWKKILPTLVKYPNACVIGIDDDFIYPSDFIKTFRQEYSNRKGIGLTGNKDKLDIHKAHCGCATLVKYEYFNGCLELLNDDMINSYADDVFYTYAMVKGGGKYEFIGTLFFTNMEKYNQVNPYSTGHKIKVHELWKNLYKPLLCDYSNIVTDEIIEKLQKENTNFTLEKSKIKQTEKPKLTIKIINKPTVIKALEPYKLPVKSITRKY